MPVLTLAASAVFALAAAGLYSYVGYRLSWRRVSAEARTAARLFALWWYALAAMTAVGGLLSLLGSAGAAALPVVVALSYLNILVVCVALWGLLYYLLYLFTGRTGALLPLSALYAAYGALLVYYVTVSHPAGVMVGRWNVQLVYEAPLGGPFFTLVLVLLLFPQLIGALAYFTLFFRVREPTQRYRIAVVSWSILIWFGSAFAAAQSGLAANDAWQLASRVIGLAAALAILLAYLPPRWVRRRYGIVAAGEELPSAAGA